MKDELYMQRCLELASLGEGYAAPNPMVGSVIVFNDRIIGEGYHKKCGEAHAEVNAVNSVKEKEMLRQSTLYVNLEPCSHWGRTPPCADMIIEYKIPKVVIGMVDPFGRVCGEGIRKLRDAGINVTVGILEEKCKALNRKFITYHSKKRPYITLKWAQTIDGYLDNNRDASTPATWMTGQACKILVHRMRSTHQAIMTGTNTIIRDNPSLTVREWFGQNAVRIVIDRNLRLTDDYNIFSGEAETIIFTLSENLNRAGKIFRNKQIIGLNRPDDICEIPEYLYTRGIQSLFVEGGAELFSSLISAGLWDEAKIFISQSSVKELNGTKNIQPYGIKAPDIPGRLISKEIIDGTMLVTSMNKSEL
ncbi:MAG: bifunctional diaminohydroxyphosphoribosylaminopyrimidine deaminase/5-amino-6-(5-phosphoribosylamino)uracil reductase RibD [Rikenellaceae bacterium]|nr:bifunctional diaminohydroxyphosphoribosylaminopyrimidine deaminase/5-amino-6-(5-phosphoribosylamino)uracil reductase RibD [Rikenellaceae bacterium]